eukprot:CAMPEP_0179414562 /NCGR_PEP_ID=MMETSP0799-20121207/5740_1 /TAXON_ID=46947 /ORGANISM="Geminigera cryophila, Strain CCMP2564" /LENGTH=52 /DNA_ID=CAMNT_0021187193 /DNA_START=750 /DNA_END=908 /DNA_ORIENTATION=+
MVVFENIMGVKPCEASQSDDKSHDSSFEAPGTCAVRNTTRQRDVVASVEEAA